MLTHKKKKYSLPKISPGSNLCDSSAELPSSWLQNFQTMELRHLRNTMFSLMLIFCSSSENMGQGGNTLDDQSLCKCNVLEHQDDQSPPLIRTCSCGRRTLSDTKRRKGISWQPLSLLQELTIPIPTLISQASPPKSLGCNHAELLSRLHRWN